jgi:hypothetical protein
LTAYALGDIFLPVQLLTSDEFAQWFTSLEQARAEDVAATLEVIAQLGTEKEAPGSSDWLTWYEHPSISARLRDLDFSSLHHPAIAQFFDAWSAFQGYARRVVKHLESPPFVARLGQLAAPDAALVADAVARIKKVVTRRQLQLSDHRILRTLGRPPTTAEAAALDRLLDEQEIRDAYLAALAAAGFKMVDLPPHSPALREIALRVPAPGFRLLYGIDVKRKRGLVVLGEPLDRSFYGDSVRVAERMWQEFMRGGEVRANEVAKVR